MTAATLTRTLRAVAYTRISEDDTERGAGVERQGEDVRERATREGFELVRDVLVDNNYSASRYAKRDRPGWLAMIDLAERGDVDAIVVYDLDRLTRQPKELEQLIDLAEAGLTIVSAKGSPVDLNSADGRAWARMMVVHAAKASDDTSRRVKRAHRQRAEQGRPNWSHRPFGFLLDAQHHADEAPVLADLYRRFVGGESLRPLVLWLNGEAIAQPTGKPFTVPALRELLKAPRNAALMPDGVSPAAWLPIIDADTYARAVRLIAAKATGQSPRAAHLLSGLATCGHCGLRLTVKQRGGAGSSGSYRCRKDAAVGHLGCGLTASLAAVDAYVVDELVRYLSNDANLAAFVVDEDNDPGALNDVVAAATLRKSELLALTRDGGPLTLADIRPELDALAATIEEATAKAKRAAAKSPLWSIASTPHGIRERFDAASPDDRRAVVAEVFAAIVVDPAAARGRRFDTDRVRLTYRYGPAA